MTNHAKTRHSRVVALLGASLLAGGCASTGGGPYGEREETQVPAGSTLVLNERLEMPGTAARVYLQQGRVIRFQDRDRFNPWCSFGLRRDDGGSLPAAIEPGEFRTGPAHNRVHARNAPSGGIRVASRSLSIGLASFSGPGPGPGHLTWKIEIPLAADGQPHVDDLTCAVDRPPHWRGELGLESIRRALGGVATIRTADGSGE